MQMAPVRETLPSLSLSPWSGALFRQAPEPPGRATDFRGGLRSSGKGSPTSSLSLPWAAATSALLLENHPTAPLTLLCRSGPWAQPGPGVRGHPARSCTGGGVEGAPPSGGPVGRGCSRGQLPPLERELISSGPGPQARAHSGSRAQRGLSRAPGTSQGQSSPREQGPEVASSGWAPCLDPAGMLTGTEALAGQVGVLGQGQGILTGGDCDVSPSACPCTCA